MASLGEELLNVVNRLQDLVFNTIGNDSLDLPQIVRLPLALQRAPRPMCSFEPSGHRALTLTWPGCCRIAIIWEVIRPREHRRQGLPASWEWHRHEAATDLATHQPSERP